MSVLEENQNPLVGGRPRSFYDDKDLRELVKKYFLEWEGKNRPLTVVGLACYLDICKETLNVYGKGGYDTPNQRFSVTIKKAKDYIENSKWEGLLTGKYHPAGAIFDLKVNHKCIEADKIPEKPQEDNDESKQEEVVDDIGDLTHDEVQRFKEIFKESFVENQEHPPIIN